MKIRYNYVVIEGNIGAGKTTLAGRIAEQFNAQLILEHFADNPFLPKFYSDPEKYSFPLELSFPPSVSVPKFPGENRGNYQLRW